jgi:hypothetical protein
MIQDEAQGQHHREQHQEYPACQWHDDFFLSAGRSKKTQAVNMDCLAPGRTNSL